MRFTGNPSAIRDKQSYVKLKPPTIVEDGHLTVLRRGTVKLTANALEVVLEELRMIFPGVKLNNEEDIGKHVVKDNEEDFSGMSGLLDGEFLLFLVLAEQVFGVHLESGDGLTLVLKSLSGSGSPSIPTSFAFSILPPYSLLCPLSSSLSFSSSS